MTRAFLAHYKIVNMNCPKQRENEKQSNPFILEVLTRSRHFLYPLIRSTINKAQPMESQFWLSDFSFSNFLNHSGSCLIFLTIFLSQRLLSRWSSRANRRKGSGSSASSETFVAEVDEGSEGKTFPLFYTLTSATSQKHCKKDWNQQNVIFFSYVLGIDQVFLQNPF